MKISVKIKQEFGSIRIKSYEKIFASCLLLTFVFGQISLSQDKIDEEHGCEN